MHDTNPKVSVVIAVRNGEHTIQAAVGSVLGQHSPADEVIVVDDGSVDETKRRVEELACARVVVLDGEARGVAAARNVGIARAHGEWIAFLDGDDHWRPEFLELARTAIASDPDAVACFGSATPVDDDGRVVGRHDMRAVVTLEDLVGGGIVPTTSATLVRRQTAVDCGGFYEDFRRPAGVEDLDLWWRIAARGRCVGVVRPVAVYVVHDDRDRRRSSEELADLEHDRELAVERFAATGASSGLVRRGRAIMRARTARYWLRAGERRRARVAARSSLGALPTVEGCMTLALASAPDVLGSGLVALRRRRRASSLPARP